MNACFGKSEMCGTVQQIENAEFLCHHIGAKFFLSEAPVSALRFLRHIRNHTHMEERNPPEESQLILSVGLTTRTFTAAGCEQPLMLLTLMKLSNKM